MSYILTTSEGMPPSMSIESFRFSTREELEQIPPVRAQIESLPPTAEEVALFEQERLNPVELPPGFEVHRDVPPPPGVEVDWAKLVLVPIAPWLIRQESAFVRLAQADGGQVGYILVAERYQLEDKPHARRGMPIVHHIGLMRKQVPWLPTITPAEPDQDGIGGSGGIGGMFS